uniref:Rhodanese domain-containing protein n=1 Tax=Strongyloides venezuelensis TaxID=75913 RepID=A0A0K0G2Y2_STRVS
MACTVFWFLFFFVHNNKRPPINLKLNGKEVPETAIGTHLKICFTLPDEITFCISKHQDRCYSYSFFSDLEMFTIEFKTKKSEDETYSRQQPDSKKKDMCSSEGNGCLFSKIVKKLSKDVLMTKDNVKQNILRNRVVGGNVEGQPILPQQQGLNSNSERLKCVKRSMSTSYENTENKDVKRRKVIEEEGRKKLPVISSSQDTLVAFERVTGETLVETMKKYGKRNFAKHFMLIDCRFPYQYEAGHIKGATNFYDITEVNDFFFPKLKRKAERVMKKTPIFYYTESLTPEMIHVLRKSDEDKKVYGDIYLLDGGYEKFYSDKKFEKFCDPCGYTAPNFVQYLMEKRALRIKKGVEGKSRGK